jgi:2-polyprenyl-6-methoxyphenol hydroxylase-like FAD-dependent oxidoreductase
VTPPVLDFYQEAQRVDSQHWETISIDALPAIGFSHPDLQEGALTWAEAQGATVLRPAKVVGVGDGKRLTVSVVTEGRSTDFRTRLAVGADGKKSSARRWLRADTVTDPEHHRFGGLLLSNVRWDDTFGWATTPAAAVGWFATSADTCRVYIRLTGFARQGSVGPRTPSWHSPPRPCRRALWLMLDRRGRSASSQTTARGRAGSPGPMVLVGDAAGALDPTQGLGTSLLFRGVRALSELLIADGDWDRATGEFARQRQAYHEVLRAYDRWCALLDAEEGPEADRRRELNAAAREADPTLGGFATLEARGPAGLVPDEEARRIYFGE